MIVPDKTCRTFRLTTDTFCRFQPVPPHKTPWHAVCKHPGIINATLDTIMDDFGNDITGYSTDDDYDQWCISMSLYGGMHARGQSGFRAEV